MKALEDNKVTTVGVYGMGGVGKTTLVEHVGQKARKQGLFDRVIKARFNQTPDVRKIQDMLADLLGITLQKTTEQGRATSLCSEIRKRNKILIILDNIWDRIDLPSIGIPTSDELHSRNSKILLTTRIKNVCHVMRSEETITLKSLSDEDSWILFEKYARKSFETTDFEDVARKVAKECGGLPIALIAVARALGDKDKDDWELAAEQLEESKVAHPDHKPDAADCIKLSYNFLEDENSRSCLLLCCLFPENYDIRIEDLFKYGVGKGLFKDAKTIHKARRKAGSVAKHLKASSLLLDSKIDGCVKMHDVVRDTAIQITQSGDEHRYKVTADVGLKNWPDRLGEGYTAISLMMNDIRELPEELVCPELEILLLQENDYLDQVPNTFFKNTSLLRVLDLSYTSISSLSKSFIRLNNLQGLYLDSCLKISDISILKNCTKLEILSMKEYPLKELSKEIRNLTNLRVLDVSGGGSFSGGIVKIHSGVLSKLRKLEELCLQCGFWNWGCKVERTTNVQFDEVTSLSNLNTLKVCIYDASCIPKKVGVNPSWIDFDIRIGKETRNRLRELYCRMVKDDHKYSRSLVLDTTINMLPPWFVDVVTTKAERVTYENATGLNDILMEYHSGMLHSLKHLSVIGPTENLETLMSFEALPSMRDTPVYKKLEELYLESIGSLKELCSGEIPYGSLCSLKVLKVCGCRNLGNVLLPSKFLQRLKNLENLFCCNMPGMEYVFGCEELKLKQSKLREMTLLDLQALKSICNGLAPPAMFQALKSLSIYRCKFQGCLFTFDVAQSLSRLENIIIESCPTLERVIEASKESEISEKTVLPKLERLCLVGLPMLYIGSADNDMVCPSLQYLYVIRCPHFRTSASDFGSKYLVKFNKVSQYLAHETTRLEEIHKDAARNNYFYLNSEAGDAPSGEELEQELLELLARRPDIRECINEFKVNVPEGVASIVLKLIQNSFPTVSMLGMLEFFPPSMIKQMSEKFKQLPQHGALGQGLYLIAELIKLLLEFKIMNISLEMNDLLTEFMDEVETMVSMSAIEMVDLENLQTEFSEIVRRITRSQHWQGR